MDVSCQIVSEWEDNQKCAWGNPNPSVLLTPQQRFKLSAMASFKKYLVISTETSSLTRDEFVLDRVAWGDLTKIKNLNDYDEIVINLTSRSSLSAKSFDQFETQINTIFNQSSWAHILLSGGIIVVVGNPNSTFVTKNDRNNIVQVQPLQAMLDLTEDSRPLDYRRVERTERNLESDYKTVNKYLDSVKTWKYSLAKIGINNFWRHSLAAFNLSVSCNAIGITSYNTALAVHFQFYVMHREGQEHRGSIICLPPLGEGAEAEDLFIIKEFLGVTTNLPAPEWVKKLHLPNQTNIENEIVSKHEEAKKLQKQISDVEAQHEVCKRWYRLLYDDGGSLEAIVKESFELLGASVAKATKEKDDYRVKVSGFSEGVMEIKGTHNPKFSIGALRQLAGWMDEVIAHESIVVKGIFVGNSARNDEPRSRDKLFEKNNENYAIIKDIVILRSMDLFCLSILKQLGLLDVDAFWKEFYGCKGALPVEKYWATVPAAFQFPNNGAP
jgi:hypothetical protein